jgi:DNA-binding response OmpR family regulator
MPKVELRTATVLIVEDDELLTGLLYDVLSDVPEWDVVVAFDAFSAQDIFDLRPIDVLVLDINLPGRSGLELLALLQADPTWHDQPVILITAAAEQPAVQAAIRAGQAVRCIAKPFELDEVVGAVAEALSDGAASTCAHDGLIPGCW